MKQNKNKIQEKAVPKKIIYAWDYVEWGGAQIYFLGLINRIKEKTKNTEIMIYLPKDSDSQLLKFIDNFKIDQVFLNIQADYKPALNIKRKIKRHINKIRAEKKLVDQLTTLDLQNTIIHIELAPWQSLLSLIRLCRKTEVFVTMHNSLPQVSRWRYELWKIKFKIITRFNSFHIFASNEDAKKSLKPLVPDGFYDKIKVTYTNVNPDEIDEALEYEIDREELLKKYKIPTNKFLVFCVGQFIDRKGRWTFLKAAKKTFEADNNYCFVWIANSKPSDEDLEKAKNYGLGENFIFLTSDQIGKEHINLFKLLRLADIFALLSFQEGLPISLLEAMALGIPSISTKVNAIPEAIKHLETGWLIEAGDDEQLTSAFLELKRDKDLRQKIAKKGQMFVLENFNEKSVAEIAFEGYIKAIGRTDR